MIEKKDTSRKNVVKKLLVVLLLLLLAGAGIVWYLFTKNFADTADLKPDYEVTALNLINEFKQNDSAANKKYSEKIITVHGRVTSVETADTTLNVRMEDASGSYIIFAFQQGEMSKLRKLKAGDSVAIKGSCSNGSYSEILETEFITFKRCSLNK